MVWTAPTSSWIKKNPTRVGNLPIKFRSESLVFCKKGSKWAIPSKKWAIRYFTHFWWATWASRSRSLIPSERSEQIAHGCSFVLSDLSNSLTLLRRNERIFCFLKKLQKNCKKCTKYNFFEFVWANSSFLLAKDKKKSNLLKKQIDLLIHSFVLSDLNESLTFGATWGIRSQLLIVLSNLSESLTFAHLSWLSDLSTFHTVSLHKKTIPSTIQFFCCCHFAVKTKIFWSY